MAPAVLWGFTFICSCCDATVLAIAETKDLCTLTQEEICVFFLDDSIPHDSPPKPFI